MEQDKKKSLPVLRGSIDLNKIPPSVIKVAGAQNHKFLNFAIFELDEPDQFGHTHSISCAPRPEERIEGVKYTIGNCDTFVKQEPVAPPSFEDIDNAPVADDISDLPW